MDERLSRANSYFVSGDLLAMNMRDNREQLSALAAEPDPAEAAKLQQQQQQQTQNKLNRKQRRKLQQQQQAEEQTPAVSAPDIKQPAGELSVSQAVTQSSETLANQQQNKTIDSISTSTYKAEDSQGDTNNTHTDTTTTKNDKPEQSVAGATKPANGQQTQSLASSKRAGPPLIPPSPGQGVQGPLRASLTHPLLHPQLVQQLHLQQFRMAQGGLLQPPFTAQQFALLQQIAQLQLVQQRLAAQSVAQQHLGQKQQVIPQQQLYQQQQQIALMIAQMQQQVLQQQPGLAGRHPTLQFTGVQQPVTQQPQQQPSPTSQPKVSKPLNSSDKLATESRQTKADTGKTQVNETVIPPPATVEEQAKQHSPVPQSRLTQWKQPLLQDPNATATQPPVSSTPTLSDSKPPTASLSSSCQSAPAMLPNLVSAPSVSTGDGSDLQASNSNTVSPRPRIPDPVSSRWGVDAGPKLSADPTEFKPGVPWRPAPKNEKREKVRDANSSSAQEVSSRSSSSSSEPQPEKWAAAANPSANAANNLPPSVAGKTSDETRSTAPSNGTGLSINSNGTFDSSKDDFGSKSASWQANDDNTPPPPSHQEGDKQASNVLSTLRPPPGLGTETTLPESPLFGEDPPAWLKSLIDSGFNGDKTQPEFQFSRFGFANHSAPWSPRDKGTQPFSPTSPDPQPWAAVGGPTPVSSTSSPTVLLANNNVACIESPSNLQNSGIIWSTNQPIPSAEEKLTGVHPGAASAPAVSMPSSVAASRSTPNSMSTWLVLRNLSPRVSKEAQNLSALVLCAFSSLSR